MSDHSTIGERIAQVSCFTSLGVLNTTQQLAPACLAGIEGADPEIVAEETLCLVAQTTARAAEVGLREEPDVAAAVIPSILQLPFSYHDYLIGGAIVAQEDTSLVEASRESYGRLLKKSEFYAAQFPPNQFPGERALEEKMEFWMGRISPPGLPEMPGARMRRLELVPILLTHLKLVLAFGRKGPGA